ncbi:hypothetical protein FA95DRAFT_1554987, partial [Auriscalpium vulgare]
MDEYELQARNEFGAAQSIAARDTVAGEVVDDVAKAAAKSGVGKTIANGVVGTLTSLGVGGLVSSLFDKFSSKDKRMLLDYIAGRAEGELAARAMKRELLDTLLAARAINEL